MTKVDCITPRAKCHYPLSLVTLVVQTCNDETYAKFICQSIYTWSLFFRRMTVPLFSIAGDVVDQFSEVAAGGMKNGTFAVGVTKPSFYALEVVLDEINS